LPFRPITARSWSRSEYTIQASGKSGRSSIWSASPHLRPRDRSFLPGGCYDVLIIELEFGLRIDWRRVTVKAGTSKAISLNRLRSGAWKSKAIIRRLHNENIWIQKYRHVSPNGQNGYAQLQSCTKITHVANGE
jgi:hypothetical protein